VHTFDHAGADTMSGVGQPVTHRVLYVEDHPVNVLLMQALFAKRPHARLVVASSAAAGLAMALEQPPDLLLLDLRLPDGHGTQLLQRMRSHAALARVPAVAVTAEDTGDLTALGFEQVWHKPMDLQVALARLDQLLARLRVDDWMCEHPRDDRLLPLPLGEGWGEGRSRANLPAPIPFPTAPR
jgi:DNA-binding response OmpR family regulator